MNNTRMPLVIGISPSKNEQYAHRAFHYDAGATKHLSRLIFGNGKHVAELDRHMHLVNLDEEVVLGPKEVPIALCEDRSLAAVPREAESFKTLDQLLVGGMLQDRIIILLGDRVAKRFFDWIGEDRPERFSVTHIVHRYDQWDCAAVCVPHPSDLQFSPDKRGPFADLMCDALGFSEEGEVSYADACLDSDGRQAYKLTMIEDFEEVQRIAAEERAAADDDDDDGVDPKELERQIRRERQALLSHHWRPFYPDSDCTDV